MNIDSRIVDAIRKPGRDERRIDVDGTPLYVYCDNNVLEVRSSPSGIGTYYFSAHRLTTFPGKQYLEFSIKTKMPDDSRYPGIYAGELMRLAVEYFKRKKGVDGIYAKWEKKDDSDNYQQYQGAISQGLSREEAAQQTWTGTQAQALGFRKPRFQSEDGAIVEFFFEK
ncbi:MAG TPA: hypothetical protein VJ246_01950 [Patescibacteria group bacterium]|nr:hypothetical protein [Patescibacteria group bacterium]